MDARIRFYKINQCGYYEEREHRFGSIFEILDNLQGWIQGKVLNETQTYGVDPDDNENTILSTYCYSLVRRNRDFLLTTWNENSDVDGKIASVNVLGLTGEACVETTEPSAGFIPGYPSFFWFLPDRGMFATVQFKTRLNGKKNLDRYLRNFLSKYSKFVVHRVTGDAYQILGYGTEEIYSKRYIPQFVSNVYRQPGQTAYILNNRAAIRKIIKRDKLEYQRPEKRELWQSLFNFILGKDLGENCTTENKINLEIDYRPSQEELEDMIETWTQDYSPLSFSDVGFKMENEQIYWLKQSSASDMFDLDVHFAGNGVLINPDNLLWKLQQRQDVIFRRVFNENNPVDN